MQIRHKLLQKKITRMQKKDLKPLDSRPLCETCHTKVDRWNSLEILGQVYRLQIEMQPHAVSHGIQCDQDIKTEQMLMISVSCLSSNVDMQSLTDVVTCWAICCFGIAWHRLGLPPEAENLRSERPESNIHIQEQAPHLANHPDPHGNAASAAHLQEIVYASLSTIDIVWETEKWCSIMHVDHSNLRWQHKSDCPSSREVRVPLFTTLWLYHLPQGRTILLLHPRVHLQPSVYCFCAG